MISDVLDQDLINSNVYYGKDVLGAFSELVVKNYKYQKVMFFCEVREYEYVSQKFVSNDFESLFFGLEGCDLKELNQIIKGIKCDVRVLVGVGSFEVIQAVKYIANYLRLPYIIIKETIPIVEELINYSVIYEGVYDLEVCEPPLGVFIDSEKVEGATRSNICEVAYSMLNKLSFFGDYYLNYIVHKTDFKCGDFVCFKDIYLQLYELLEKLSMLDKESILRLGDLVLYLSVLLKRLDYSMDKDKIFVFTNLYLLLAKKSATIYNFCMVGQVGLQVLNGVYKKFIQELEKLSFDYIDIEKRVRMFDLYFQNYKLAFNAFEFPNVERMKFVLLKNKKIINTKVDILNELSSKLLNKSFLLHEDSGYSIVKNLDSLAVVKSVCFCADVVKGECFLKIIRDYGVLDMF